VKQAPTSENPSQQSASHTLARSLRERDLLFLFVGSVIGSGIFLTPGLILRQLSGSVGYSLLVWLVGGILSLLGALTYAELAAANPEAGGLYCYIRDGFGRLPAFLYGWSLFLIVASATIAALAHAFTTYLQQIIRLTSMQSSAVVVLMIAVVTAVNVWGTRKSSDLQNVTTIMKVGIILVLGSALLLLGSWQGKHVREISPAMGSSLSDYALFSSFGLAMITVLWAYEGWQFGTYSAGEVIDPQKSFPRAFLYGSLILVGLYLFAVASYLVALGPKAAIETDAIAATAAEAVLGGWAGKLVAAAILVSAPPTASCSPHRAFFSPWPMTISSSKNLRKSIRATAPRPRRFWPWAYGLVFLRLPVNLRSSRMAPYSSAGFFTERAPPPFFRSAGPTRARRYPIASPATRSLRSSSC
jgi:basic amino acid/polyamine antiporter, APA family